MTNVLHILNGDSTAKILAKSSIKGTVIVWREMLCEGSLHTDVGSDNFWKKRYSFFENEVGVNRLEYYDKTIKETVKLEDLSGYNKVVLWFEYDLFCQVNLLAILVYLLKYYRKDIRYYLICTGKKEEKKQLQSLTNYSSKEYKTLFENKIKLTQNNLLFAEQCWSLFV